jgi:transcription elongation factor GreA
VPQPTEENVTWLTQDAYDKLVAELEYLKGPARSEISQRIGDARDEGDLKENGGYHAAKEEQGMAEARIRILENMLRRAKVGQTPGDNGVVGLGMTVTVRFEGDDETETFLLGSRELVGLDETVGVNVYSPQSPLGAAVTGKHTGDEASFKAPNGKRVTVQIVDAKPYNA